MTPITNTQHAFTINSNILPDQHKCQARHAMTRPRRTSAVLSVQELRQIVCQMVD